MFAFIVDAGVSDFDVDVDEAAQAESMLININP